MVRGYIMLRKYVGGYKCVVIITALPYTVYEKSNG